MAARTRAPGGSRHSVHELAPLPVFIPVPMAATNDDLVRIKNRTFDRCKCIAEMKFRRDYCSARVIFDEGASNADLKVALATFCCDAEHTEYFKFWMPRDVAALYDAAFAIQKANRTACMQKAEALGLETSGAVGELRARISTHLMDRVPPMETWKQRDTETANASDAGDADDARDARDAGDAPDAGDARGASDAGDE